MQVYYDGAHSVKFGDFRIVVENGVARIDDSAYLDSWTAWGLIPKSLPVIAPAPVVKKQIEIYGANSAIDLTEVPRGFPVYQNRTGTLDFYVDGSDPDFDWVSAYDMIVDHLHGTRTKLMLTDDPNSFYVGRFDINSWKAGNSINEISINYDLDPYKYDLFTTAEDWMWDPFDFWHGIIPASRENFVNIDVATTPYVIWTTDMTGKMPVIPKFTLTGSTNGATIQVYNSVRNEFNDPVTIQNGDTEDPRLEICAPKAGSYVRINMSGDGLLTCDFRPGRL